MARRRNRIMITFRGAMEYAEKLDKLGGDLRAVSTEALVESHALVTPNIHSIMKRHHRTGRTEGTIRDEDRVQWEGMVASIPIGFDIRNGGLPSIFLMYGTPKMAPDKKLYNAIYGSATRRKVANLQKEIFAKAIRERLGG